MESLKKAEFLISVDTLGEKYNDQSEVCCKLKINYENKTYKIIPPKMLIETDCNFPHFVSQAIELAYKKAIAELYSNK